METKTMAAFAMALLAAAGMAYAMPFWGAGLGAQDSQDAPMQWRELKNQTLEDLSGQLGQFHAAVAEGDYAAAKGLHEEYGFGGRMFERLSESSFPKYSQVYNLHTELMEELGINATGMGFGRGGRFGKGTHAGFRGEGCPFAQAAKPSSD